MGLVLSIMGIGLSPRQILSFAIQGVFQKIKAREVDNFEDFHSSILNLYKAANSAMPGRHFEAPSYGKVKKAFKKWQSETDESKKKEIFIELLQNIKLGDIDNLTLMVGVAAPPFSMVVKRAGENAHRFKMIKRVPDALFVPSFTLLSVVSVKLFRKAWKGITEEEKEEEEETNVPTSRRDNTAALQGA